jgi:hypothetical protein
MLMMTSLLKAPWRSASAQAASTAGKPSLSTAAKRSTICPRALRADCQLFAAKGGEAPSLTDASFALNPPERARQRPRIDL